MRALHDAVVVRGWVSPRDFWEMAPGEVWWVIEAHQPRQPMGGAEGMGELYRMLKESQAKERAMRDDSDGA